MLRRVTKSTLEKIRIRGEWLLRLMARRRGLVLRTLLCWAIGCLALTADEYKSYDRRFNLRGEQKADADVVILTMYPSDFLRSFNIRTNSLANVTEISDITDSLFWDRQTWVRLLSRILTDRPRSIGVTLWFGENIGPVRLDDEERMVLQDPRVVWATSVNNLERMMKPVFARGDLANVASIDLRRDEDGVIRRYFPERAEVPTLVGKLSGRPLPRTPNGLVINYRGSSARTFTHYTLSELLNDEIRPGAFKDKIVLLGGDGGDGPRLTTPIGPMQRTEVVAQLLDNHLQNRWITRLPFGTYAALFFVLTLLAVFLITTYPQSVVILFFIWIGTLCVALSAWVFDTFAIWIPALSPFMLLIATWIIFIGYQATKVERLNARLKQEQLYLRELEQLKNNFVSLISHDLKTPIAKIQAVVDRLRAEHGGGPLEHDLKSLHDFSDELNRYIQSILKVLRVESRDFKLNREVGDINEVIVEALRLLRPLAAEKNIRIETDLEPMFSAEFDVTLIKEVVINLIENAIKYTPPGGEVRIRSTETENETRVEVRDTGVGIAPEELERVWRKFTRGRDQDHKTKGTGLGLYLVKYFIELHGGRVRLESELGKGSTVSFTLPLVDDTKSEQIQEVNG